jgi:uncharacterized membrane protein YfcA
MEGLLDTAALGVLIPVVCIATFVFITVGFGGGVVAVPLALLFLEPRFALPVLAIVEACTAVYLLKKHHREVVWPDVGRIVPASAVGTVAGVWILVSLSAPWLMLSLSAFIAVFLLTRGLTPQSQTPIPRFWAIPSGLLAGVCSGAFGAGGPPSAVYFSLRQLSVDQLRSSMATTGSANLILRLSGFGLAGLYAKPVILVTALCLLPFAAVTAFVASKARSKMTSQNIIRATYAILAFSAISLAIRSQSIPH